MCGGGVENARDVGSEHSLEDRHQVGREALHALGLPEVRPRHQERDEGPEVIPQAPPTPRILPQRPPPRGLVGTTYTSQARTRAFFGGPGSPGLGLGGGAPPVSEGQMGLGGEVADPVILDPGAGEVGGAVEAVARLELGPGRQRALHLL